MKKRKKLVILTVSIVLLFCVSITIYNLSLNKKVIMSSHNTKENNDMISFLLETGMKTKQYKESTDNEWPEKYTLNKTLSKCENGGRLEFDENNSMVSLKTKSSDKCYVYFDYPIPDIYVDTTNIPTTYGALANLSCNGATSTYNEKYQRIEISQLSTKNASCNLNYTNRTSKTYLNDYIMGLSGTTQGDGKFVHELETYGNFNGTSKLSESDFGTITQYYSSSLDSTSGTTTSVFQYANTQWTTDASKLSSNRYYHINFTVPSNGYYRLEYELSSGSGANYIVLFEENVVSSKYVSASTSGSTSGYIYLGYVTSGTHYRLVQYTYSTISSLKFSVSKTDSVITLDADNRYEGRNPNNYVWFNDELWRIIGVFDSNTHGQGDVTSTAPSENLLVKIIRASSIGSHVWNNSTSNSDSILRTMLNSAYYNQTDGTGNGYCRSYYNYVPGSCDYKVIGIGANYRKMIKEVTWKLGKIYNNDITVRESYSSERSGSTTTKNVGIMYVSDYGYAVLADDCKRRTTLGTYDRDGCSGKNWLYGQGTEWTLTLSSLGSAQAYAIDGSGIVSNHNVFYGFNVRPVVYLDSSVYRISGTGSESDPYIIGM